MTCFDWNVGHRDCTPGLLNPNVGASQIEGMFSSCGCSGSVFSGGSSSIYDSYYNGGLWSNDFASQINNRNEVSLGDSFMAGVKEMAYSNPFGTLGCMLALGNVGFGMLYGLSNGISNWAEGRTTSQYSNIC